jgi:hypothetical protein
MVLPVGQVNPPSGSSFHTRRGRESVVEDPRCMCTHKSPTGPAPKTATLAVGRIAATVATALTATARGSIYAELEGYQHSAAGR